ncbi:MAG: 4-(cytidine 5'-diphospho)-2-C-methyl-D-erythritol kinase [Rhodospirillales bacterium]|nr:4-(cytidine 5'-diphospho)-2-C-methyl-D-erythritol kinase [Rhodospirillales bacterium]
MPDEDAPAKVNLFLLVTGRRADGYHTLDSLVVFADIADRLSATKAQDLTLSIDGSFFADLPTGAENLVLRAARALAAAAGIGAGAAFRLTKVLPHAAGIGGGSADAAAALRLLSRLWGLPRESVDLLPLAAGLGADVPVCLFSRPARLDGIGEMLRPAPALPRFGLCLVNPGLALPTKAVFAARRGPFSEPAYLPSGWPDAPSLAADLARLRNDLEAPAMTLCPPIATVLDALAAAPGCLLARMSGSGATCFGLFPDAVIAREAAGKIARPGWWCWGGGLARSRL